MQKKNLLCLSVLMSLASLTSCGAAKDVEINYYYGGQFFGDANITAKMEGWYAAGTELVFACGGGIYTSAAEAAKNNGGKVIGVDVDQRPTIDATYGAGITVTSAMKGLQNSVELALGQFYSGNWEKIGGKTDKLGLDKDPNGVDYVGIPTSDASWNFENFTKNQYNEVVGKIRAALPEKSSESTAKGSKLVASTNTIALVTDVGTIDDESFNQAAWQGVKSYAEANSKTYNYYQPTADSTIARETSIAAAVLAGAEVIVCPGYLFEEAVYNVQTLYPNVAFILLDGEPHTDDYSTYHTEGNVYCVLYQEEQAGFLAGYAAVKEGFRKVGFLGGMAVPAVVRYGYGFVQGCDVAIREANGEKFDKIEISPSTESHPEVSEHTSVTYVE